MAPPQILKNDLEVSATPKGPRRRGGRDAQGWLRLTPSGRAVARMLPGSKMAGLEA